MLAISKGSASPAARPARAPPRHARACSVPKQATACHAGNLQGKRLASSAPSTRGSTPCPRVFCTPEQATASHITVAMAGEALCQRRAQHARLDGVPARVLRQNRQQRVMLAISKGSASPAARPARAPPRRARACSVPKQATACHASNLQRKRFASTAPSTRGSTACPRVFCAKTGNSVSCWQSPREAPRQQRAQHARLHAVPARVLHAPE